MTFNNDIPYKVRLLEKENMTTTNQDNYYDENTEISLKYIYDFLYHGIRFQKYLEKLENIFKSGKILAGKYIENYCYYSDNCNMGEYVSLLKLTNDNKLAYDTFIGSNISLIVSPVCNAIETKYIDYETWEKIKCEKLNNIYSYMIGECLCKDYIPINMVKAIGIPYSKLKYEKSIEYVNKLLEDICNLMQKYDIKLPIVDTSRYNYILVENKMKTRKK